MTNSNSIDKNNLLLALQASVQTLQQGIDVHCWLVDSLLDRKTDNGIRQSFISLCPKRTGELRLERAIQEALHDIKESRKAFKSKRLEALRKKLIQVLVEQD